MSTVNPLSKLRDAIKAQLAEVNIIPDSSRDITITFRVSQAEKLRLESRCEGILQSDYIRARLFDYALPRRKAVMPVANQEVRYQLKQIAANLNQQTLDINQAVQQGLQPLNKDVKAYSQKLKAVEGLIKELRKQLDLTTLGSDSQDDAK